MQFSNTSLQLKFLSAMVSMSPSISWHWEGIICAMSTVERKRIGIPGLVEINRPIIPSEDQDSLTHRHVPAGTSVGTP